MGVKRELVKDLSVVSECAGSIAPSPRVRPIAIGDWLTRIDSIDHGLVSPPRVSETGDDISVFSAWRRA